MHASIEQLLNPRDGNSGDGVAAHVSECAECGATLARLNLVTAALRSLPSHAAAPDRWPQIAARLSGARAPQSAPRSRPGWFLPAAAAALVLVAVLLTFDRDASVPARQTTETVPAVSARQLLLSESQRLESLLAAMPAEPRVTRAHTAMTVADLEDRIQWVDYRLNFAHEAGLARDQADRLLRERVDLLNSLVAVRYSQTRVVAF